MPYPRLAFTPRDRMLKQLEGFHTVYRREAHDLSLDDLAAIYDQLACYLSELHDDCTMMETTLKLQREAKKRDQERALVAV